MIQRRPGGSPYKIKCWRDAVCSFKPRVYLWRSYTYVTLYGRSPIIDHKHVGPFTLNISIHILLTLLLTFPLVVTRRFYLWIIALKLAIISFIRVTLMNDSAVLMRGKSDLATPKVLRADYERSAHHRSVVNLWCHAFVMHAFLFLGARLLTVSGDESRAGGENIWLSFITKWTLEICKQTLSKPLLYYFK